MVWYQLSKCRGVGGSGRERPRAGRSARGGCGPLRAFGARAGARPAVRRNNRNTRTGTARRRVRSMAETPSAERRGAAPPTLTFRRWRWRGLGDRSVREADSVRTPDERDADAAKSQTEPPTGRSTRANTTRPRAPANCGRTRWRRPRPLANTAGTRARAHPADKSKFTFYPTFTHYKNE